MVIYKNYNQEALDKQYNNRAAVPNFAQIVDQWKQQSAETRERVNTFRDLQYGLHERERLDIFPAQSADAPVQVFFHGGYWQAMDKEVFHFIANSFVERGVTTVLVNYPLAQQVLAQQVLAQQALAPQASMDDLIASCQKSLAWLHAHMIEYSGDPDKIFISGHSAGGHIVAMLMATDWSKFDLPDDVIKGGCAISGLFNLLPIQLCYLNNVLGMDEAVAYRNSPVSLSPTCTSPLIVTVGQLESAEYHAQTQELIDAWSSKGTAFTHLSIPDADHFSILEHFTNHKASLNQAVLNQLGIDP